MLKLYILFSVVFLIVLKKSFSEELPDNDIPVVEGDGGTITTNVEDDVLVLTTENFDIQVMSKDIILVEFYAPWCGHCKALEPEFSKAAKILKDADPPVPLAKVDATVQAELATRYEITGYPTLFVFKKGQKVEYDGPRTAMGIVEHMKELSDPNWKPPPEAVITLTKDNFKDIVLKADIILVEFYAPWCGHCKRLAPEYERAAKVLKDLPYPIPLAKIDGIAEKELADQYDAKGWPTLMIFRKGQKYAYEGPRDEPGIISYMKEQAKPPSEECVTLKQLKNKLGKIDPSVVGFFDSDSDALFKNFMDAANTLRGKFNFFHSFQKDSRKHFGLKNPEIIVLMSEIFTTPYEPHKYELKNNEATTDEIAEFVQKHSLPLVGQRSLKSQWKYADKYPLVIVYYDVDFSFDHRVQTQLIRNEVGKVAKDYSGQLTFAVSDESEYEVELQELGLADSGEDVNVAFFDSKKTKYRMEPVEDFSADELRAFVEDVLAGQIPKHIKSQPIPKDSKGPVVAVVGKTFDKLVTNSDKDVLLEFYAPWCGHCKKLEPIYKKLAKAFAANKKIVVAKIDATANDFPGEFEVTGFPTLYYVPANDKKNPKVYDGERSLDDLTKFINDQLSGGTVKEEL